MKGVHGSACKLLGSRGSLGRSDFQGHPSFSLESRRYWVTGLFSQGVLGKVEPVTPFKLPVLPLRAVSPDCQKGGDFPVDPGSAGPTLGEPLLVQDLLT